MKPILIALLVLAGPLTLFASDLRERTRGYRHLRQGTLLVLQTDNSLYGAFGGSGEPSSAQSSESDPLALSPAQRDGYERAIVEFHAAAKLIPQEEEVYVYLASCHWALDRLETAISFYSKAVELNPARDDVISARMTAFLQMGDIASAARDLGTLRELESEFVTPQEKALKEARAGEPGATDNPDGAQ